MFNHLRNKIRSSRRHQIIVSVFAISILLLGVVLLYESLRPIHAPDMNDASANEVIAFLCDDYANVPPARQQQFMRQLADWYLKLDHNDRTLFENSWHDTTMPKDIKSRLTAQVRVSTINQLSGQYATITDSEKKQFLAQVTFMMKALPSGKKLEHVLRDKKQWEPVFNNPKRYWQTKDKYATELAHHASAEQRANLAKLLRDLAEYNGIR